MREELLEWEGRGVGGMNRGDNTCIVILVGSGLEWDTMCFGLVTPGLGRGSRIELVSCGERTDCCTGLIGVVGGKRELVLFDLPDEISASLRLRFDLPEKEFL